MGDLSMNLYTQMPDQLLWKDSHLATSLTKLSINQNRLQSFPDDIQEMRALRTLCCYDNTLTSLHTFDFNLDVVLCDQLTEQREGGQVPSVLRTIFFSSSRGPDTAQQKHDGHLLL